MLALAPLLFSGPQERAFFLEGPGRACALAALRTLAASAAAEPGLDALVLADDPRGEELARACALPCAPVPPVDGPEENHGPLAPELEAARLWAATNPQAGPLVLAVSPRAPLLAPEDIRNAAALARLDQPVLSLAAPRDHPVQYQRHAALLGTERIALLDPQAPAHGPRTLPFPAPSGEKHGDLHVREDGLAVLALPRLAPGASPGPGSPAGVALGDHFPGEQNAEAPQPRLLRQGDRLRLLWPAHIPAEGAFARLILLDAAQGTRAVFDLAPGPDGADMPLPEAGVFGALCLYLRQDPGGTYDLALPFLPDDTVWRLDGARESAVNSATGRAVCGRQDFMAVLRPDGALFSARREDLQGLPRRLARGGFRPLELDPRRALRVENEFDLLLAGVRGLPLELP